MGRIKWEVKDCIPSRQDYIVAVKNKNKRQVARQIAQDGGRRVGARMHRSDVDWRLGLEAGQ